MSTQLEPRPSNIVSSFKLLKGNTRTSVIFEPLWGIPFVLYNFYLSLYMKELGVTDRQIGYLISIGFIAGTFFSLLGGTITDRLGRKRTTLIFDFISWPVSMLIYFLSNSFWIFALATVTNSLGRIVGVSWNLMVVEDADNAQRVAAFNLLNIITISTGVLIPLGGILVNAYGVVEAERIFLLFAAISMALMIILRNHFYRETKIGQQILEENRKNPVKIHMRGLLQLKAAGVFKRSSAAAMAACVYILFNLYLPLGTLNSLYFAPYVTEVLHLDKSRISILGGAFSAVIFVIFVFLNPIISKFNTKINMIVGLVIQSAALLLLIAIPEGSLVAALLCIILFGVGFGLFRPFVDSLLAEVTEGKERAGIYSIVNTFTCLSTALVGFVSGSIYIFNPRLIYVGSMVILLVCVVILAVLLKSGSAAAVGQENLEG